MSNLVSKKEEFIKFVSDVQEHICEKVEAIDGKAKFQIDDWTRDGFGYGSTRVISDGSVIEKGGVNYSVVGGELPKALQEKFEVDRQHRYFISSSPSKPVCSNGTCQLQIF